MRKEKCHSVTHYWCCLTSFPRPVDTWVSIILRRRVWVLLALIVNTILTNTIVNTTSGGFLPAFLAPRKALWQQTSSLPPALWSVYKPRVFAFVAFALFCKLTCLFIHLFVCLYVCFFVSLFVCLFLCLFVCLLAFFFFFFYLFVCLNFCNTWNINHILCAATTFESTFIESSISLIF